MNTDVLIIDECSMISARTFECIEKVLALKNNKKLFGGIQVILCGDFLQLPPVKNISYDDSGFYCFESSFFKLNFPHRVVLDEIVRQSEDELIRAIHHVSRGLNIPEETCKFIKTLERPLPNSNDFDLKLFAKNDLVDDLNRKCILDFPGQMFEFTAKDEGEQKYRLDSLTVPKCLWLKIGIPVILLRNLTTKLVNGLRGFVLDIDDEGPTIEFPSIGITTRLSEYPFEVFSPRLNKNVAVPTQYPIKPAFGLTIHKAQGMTLDRVEVDCTDIFQAGQLGVAMSRAKTVDGLRVINFHQRCCIAHSDKVYHFIEEESLDTKKDNSCCRNKERLESTESASKLRNVPQIPEESEIIDPDDQFDKDFDTVIQAMDTNANEILEFSLPADFSVNDLVRSIKVEKPKTLSQLNIKNILLDLPEMKLELFCKKEFIFLSKFMEELNITEPRAVKSKELSEYYLKIQKHLSSFEYKLNCISVFDYEKGPITDDHMSICLECHLAVRKYIMRQKTNLYSFENQTVSTRFITVQSKARLRYVAGYCIAKLLYSYSKKKGHHRFCTSKDSQVIYEDILKTLSILNLMKDDEENLKSYTTDEASLADICRRQNVSRSLTHISDEMFRFFIMLCENCLKLLISENLNKYGENMYSSCLDELLQNKQLRTFFNESMFSRIDHQVSKVKSLLQTEKSRSDYIEKIYEELVKKIFTVVFAQFRKDVKSSFHVEKTLAHRKQIQITKKKKGNGKETPDSSVPQPIASQPSATDDEHPGPSGLQNKSKVSHKGKRQGKRHADKEIKKYNGSYLNEDGQTIWVCPVCGIEEDESQPMIGCDECNDWLHWSCVGLENEPTEELWFCPDCDTSTFPKIAKKQGKRGKGKKKK